MPVPTPQKFEFRRWTGEVGAHVLKQLRLPVGDLARLQPSCRSQRSEISSLKGERFRLAAPATLAEARHVVAAFVAHYNEVRLHSALGYITPADKLAGLEEMIFAERDRKLEEARQQRRATTRAASGRSTTAEEASPGVQRGGNEHPLQEPAQDVELVA